MSKTLSDERVALIRKAGSMIMGDWSGVNFDGRSVNKWLTIALDGTDEEVTTLLADLNQSETW
jgi:hypothetical protein